ncbi:Tyrosine phosphatase family [Novymonas esmeraldas]|uniref:protein-tyrosine-phosphatase n=1 Tax=Novymonas esmeraldas TaxID=1808958 RepID=A0AAW0F2P5_9TRYP
MKVIPPNFGYVEEGIFRCGAPEPRHYGFLSSLGLRTCILLTDIHDDAFVLRMQESGVTIFCPLVSEAQGRAAHAAPSTTNGADDVANGGGNNNNNNSNQRRGGGVATGASTGGAAVNLSSSSRAGVGKDDSHDGAANTNTVVPTTTSGGGGDAAGGGGRAPLVSPDLGGTVNNMDGDGSFDGTVDVREDDRAGGGGGVSGGRGWPFAPGVSAATTTTTATTTGGGGGGGGGGTSNAVRFLQENAGERQISSKYSPVFIPEPLYFPANGSRLSSGIDAAAPSYEGKLHGLMTLSEAVVVSILHILVDPQYYPLLITCSKGRYRSGIVCGCLRKLQGWNLVSILEEYRRFAGNKSRADNEEFIELFDEDLVSLELPDGRRPTILYNS